MLYDLPPTVTFVDAPFPDSHYAESCVVDAADEALRECLIDDMELGLDAQRELDNLLS